MRPLYFVVSLVVTFVLATWLLLRMIITTDPDSATNVAIVLFLLFVVTGTLVTLLSWILIRRFWEADRYGIALRHGAWFALFLVSLPVLRWMDILSLPVAGSVLLVLVGLESLLLLQQGRAGAQPAGAEPETPVAEHSSVKAEKPDSAA